MNATETRKSLEQAVANAPFSVESRLVLADWYEENGIQWEADDSRDKARRLRDELISPATLWLVSGDFRHCTDVYALCCDLAKHLDLDRDEVSNPVLDALQEQSVALDQSSYEEGRRGNMWYEGIWEAPNDDMVLWRYNNAGWEWMLLDDALADDPTLDPECDQWVQARFT
jgi:hypothetical protein